MSTTRTLEPVAEHASSTTRRCIEPGCNTPLSLYNSNERCWYHQSKARRAVIGMSATQNTLQAWSPPLLFPPPKPRKPLVAQKLMAPPMSEEAVTPSSAPTHQPPGATILRVGCEYFAQSKENITSPRRERSLTHVRQVLMFLMKRDTKLSLPAIGRMFQRDHSTVVYAVKKINSLYKTDARLQHDIAAIRTQYQKPPM